ncbi:unnamed protein product [Lymnaea stagnalis]|uniref:Adenosine deaminase domain-containing protein n=1 Tax=Lymnaea stagnalis TaxID=6523 RepID=A0AAV2HU29_LYMST
MDIEQEEIYVFCHSLPKVELHAHLNTSYSRQTLEELMDLKGGSEGIEEMHISSNKDIDESFTFFTKIQKLVTTKEAVYLLTRRVIEEFAQDNVKYLELRSTPKEIPETGMTRELYMRTMIDAVKDCQKEGLDIVVRLLVSIDRRHGTNIAEITIELAEKLMQEEEGLVIGIDVSGDPKVGDATDLIPVLIEAGKRNLKLALHLAELPLYAETRNVLKACCQDNSFPVRIGHGTYLHRSDQQEKSSENEMEDLVLQKRIPLEACITSNLRTMTVDSVEKHHFKYWYDKDHPIVICTDGKGVYNTSLTQEYVTAATVFNLNKEKIKAYIEKTIDCIFEGDVIKEKLRQKLRDIPIK